MNLRFITPFDEASIDPFYCGLRIFLFVLFEDSFPLLSCLFFKGRPAQSSPTFGKSRATQPRPSRASTQVQRRLALGTWQVRQQCRHLWRGDVALLVEVEDAITIRVSAAAQECAETTHAQQHGISTFWTGHICRFWLNAVSLTVDGSGKLTFRVPGTTEGR